MKKKIIAFTTCLLLCCTFMLNGFVSNAQIGTGGDGLDFYVPYAMPEGENVGYISVVLKKGSSYQLTTFFWIAEPLETFNNSTVAFNTNAVVYFSNQNHNEIHIEISNISDNVQGLGGIFRYVDYSNNLTVNKQVDVLGVNDVMSYALDFSVYGFEVVGFQFGGNCVFTTSPNYNGYWQNTPRIHWGGDNSVQLLGEICSLLGQGLVPLKLYLPKLSSIDMNLSEIKQLLDEMYGTITDDEQQKVDQFEEDSGSQSEELGSLNQQTQVDKPDVDSVSQQVDSVLEMDIDANYGVLLSTFTSNGRILTMMLLCVSVALISFVLFGKRD